MVLLIAGKSTGSLTESPLEQRDSCLTEIKEHRQKPISHREQQIMRLKDLPTKMV